MKTRSSVYVTALAVLMFSSLLSGCASIPPTREIEKGLETPGDKVRFYYETRYGSERGVLQCEVAGNGDLKNCEKLDINFKSSG